MIIIYILIAAGAVFSVAAIIETDKRKKRH